jgi:hypothetical protein
MSAPDIESPPPFNPQPDPPKEISVGETLTGIFFEPGAVFESLRTRPRFLVAGLVLILLTVVVTAVLYARVDMGQFIREKMDRSPRAAEQTEAQKEMGAKIGKTMGMIMVPLSVPIGVAAGAALYLLGVMAFAGSISYRQSVSLWVYSSLPPSVVASLVAVIVLLIKSPDTIDPEHMLVTNPGAFMGDGSSPALVALLTQFDLVKFYGLFLAALGLRKIAKLSSGSAWGLVLGYWLIGTVLRVIWALAFGN